MPVGAPAMLKLARRWGCDELRAAALLRRVDVVDAVAPLNGLRLSRGEDLPARFVLPPATLLVLDAFDELHLVALRDRLFLSVRETLMSWRSGDVRVVIRPGGGNFRPVELRYGATTLVVAGPWRTEAQRDALELIERVTLEPPAPAWRQAQ
jgi:hypothetical protein